LQKGTDTAEQRYKEARNRKVAIIRKYKRECFRSQVAAAASSTEGTWKIAKWAKMKAGVPQQPPQLPQLTVKERSEDGTEVTRIAKTLAEKTEALRIVFFPKPPTADLRDITDYHYPEPLPLDMDIKEDDIRGAIRYVAKDKAPGPDQILNRILHAVIEWITPHLHIIFNACVRNGYHPTAWKRATTLALRKPNKEDYTIPKAYRPIALLNTMGKILELVMARKLSQLAEENNLLPQSQMGARKGRSMETALQLLTEQVHEIWNLPGAKRVATLLSMDISGAFPNVSHRRLIHNLRKRKIPTAYTNWVGSFLKERKTTIKLFEGESQEFTAETGIP
jgi:hypothetical protein